MNRRKLLISGALWGAAIAVSYHPLVNLLDNFIRQRIEIVNEAELEEMLTKIREGKRAELDKDVSGIKENLVDINTVTDFITKYKKIIKISVNKISGGGLIYKDYILTVNHVSSDSKYSFIKRMFGELASWKKAQINKEIEYEKMGEGTFTGKKTLEEVIKIFEKDLAIFHLPKKYLKSQYNVKLGDSDKLKLFDKVYLIGNPGRQGVATRPGIIGSKELIKYFGVPWSGMVVSTPTESGDSGNPLINEKGEVVGLASSSVGAAYSLFIPINLYKDEISKYEALQGK